MRLTGGKVILREKRLEDAWLDYLWRSDKEIARLDAAFPLKMTFQEFLRLFRDQLRYPTPGFGPLRHRYHGRQVHRNLHVLRLGLDK